ncbi:MAG TPA: YraN family protein [Planctomycetaceae bacterium]
MGWLPRWFGSWTGRVGTRLFGDRGERAAARHLRRQGMRVIARQHRSRLGEIDLIALDAGCVVFVEVKTRKSDAAGRPEEAVTPAKQRKLTRLALEYLKRRRWLGRKSARFDVVAVTWPDGCRRPEIVHYRNAFEPVGVDGMFS